MAAQPTPPGSGAHSRRGGSEGPRSAAGGNGARTPPDRLDQETLRFFYRWAGEFSTTLIRIRSRFSGDLDQCLLFMVFVLSELAAARSGAGESQGRGLNALSLSEITSIPRETARRKLLALVAAGYLRRGTDGLFHLGDRYGVAQFVGDLRPLFGDAAPPER